MTPSKLVAPVQVFVSSPGGLDAEKNIASAAIQALSDEQQALA